MDEIIGPQCERIGCESQRFEAGRCRETGDHYYRCIECRATYDEEEFSRMLDADEAVEIRESAA